MKKIFFQVHRWVGLGAVLFLTSQVATGVVLAIHAAGAVLRPLTGQSLAGPSDFGSMVAAVRQARPRHRIDRIVFPRAEGDPYVFRLQPVQGGPPGIVTADARTGAILAAGSLLASPSQAALAVHAELLSGATGKRVVGFLGASVFVLALTGLYLWWRPRERWARALAIHWSGRRARLVYDLHQVLGALAVPIVCVLAATGAMVALKSDLRAVVGRVLQVEPETAVSPVQVPGATPLLGIHELLPLARAHFPGQPIRDIRISNQRVVRVYFLDDANPRPGAANEVWLDAATGRTLAVVAARTEAPGDRMLNWMLPIHCGEWLGLPGGMLVLFTGLGLAVLGVTGPWLALVRYAARRRAARRKA